MSDPDDIPDRRRPPRAAPSVGPGPDDTKQHEKDPNEHPSSDSAKDQKAQSDAAIDNMREGFDH